MRADIAPLGPQAQGGEQAHVGVGDQALNPLAVLGALRQAGQVVLGIVAEEQVLLDLAAHEGVMQADGEAVGRIAPDHRREVLPVAVAVAEVGGLGGGAVVDDRGDVAVFVEIGAGVDAEPPAKPRMPFDADEGAVAILNGRAVGRVV